MTMGNIVSATGSGLGCPDWPLCHGHLLPPAQTEVLIEFSHRLKAIPFTLLLLVTVVLTWRRTKAPAPRRLSVILLGLVAAQIVLGGITVLFKLPDLVSTAHLVNALLILAGLLILAEGNRAHPAVPAKLKRLARAGVWVLLVQLALGGCVRHAGAGLACPDFRCAAAASFPSLGGTVHWVHAGSGWPCSSSSSSYFWPLDGPRWPGPPRSPWVWPCCRSRSASPPSWEASPRPCAPLTP
jgi:heme A synthase